MEISTNQQIINFKLSTMSNSKNNPYSIPYPLWCESFFCAASHVVNIMLPVCYLAAFKYLMVCDGLIMPVWKQPLFKDAQSAREMMLTDHQDTRKRSYKVLPLLEQAKILYILTGKKSHPKVAEIYNKNESSYFWNWEECWFCNSDFKNYNHSA